MINIKVTPMKQTTLQLMPLHDFQWNCPEAKISLKPEKVLQRVICFSWSQRPDISFAYAYYKQMLYASRKEGLTYIPSNHCPSYIGFKHLWIVPQHCSRIVIQGILMIRFLKRTLLCSIHHKGFTFFFYNGIMDSQDLGPIELGGMPQIVSKVQKTRLYITILAHLWCCITENLISWDVICLPLEPHINI